MKPSRVIAVFLFLACVGPGRLEPGPAAAAAAENAPTMPPSVTLPPELARVLTDYEQAWAAKDEHALAALFTPDGWVLSSGHPPVHGRAAIVARYRDSGGPLALRALAYTIDGELATIIGAYAAAPGDPDAGKFTLTLRRGDDARWLIVSDMDNGNRRPPMPPFDPCRPEVVSSREIDFKPVNEDMVRFESAGQPWLTDLDAVVAFVLTKLVPGDCADTCLQIEKSPGEGCEWAVVTRVRTGFLEDSIRGDWLEVRLVNGGGRRWRIQGARLAQQCWRSEDRDVFVADPCP